MEHAGDNAVHLSVGAEMEAYDDEAVAHTVIQGPIARGIQGGRGGGGGGEVERTPLLNRSHPY